MEGNLDRQPPAGRPVTRRRFLGGGALGLAAAGLAACGGKSTPSTATSGGARVAAGPPGPGPFSGGRYGGTVTTGWLDEANTYDPAIAWNDQGWTAISCVLNTPLYMFGTQFGDLQPALAAALPTISDDGRRYLIKLKPGLRFSDGSAVTAADFVYAWTRVLDPKVASWASGYLLPIEGASAVASGKAKVVTGLSALDDTTLQVTLTTPTFAFLNYLAEPFMAPVPEAAVGRLGKKFHTHPVGTGPFVVDSYSTSDQKATFVRNPHYAWKGLPYLDGLTFTWGLNDNLALLQLQKHSIEVVGDGFGSDVLPQVTSTPGLQRYLQWQPENSTVWIALNVAKPELSDPRVRQALNWAVDRAALAEVSHGTWKPSGYPLPNTLADFHHTATPFGHDVARARSLLAAAGVHGLEVGFLTDGESPWSDTMQLLQQQWHAVDVTFKIDTVSESAWSTETTTVPLKIDSFQDNYYMDQPSALDMIIPNFSTGGSYNTNGYSNKAIDALIAEAQAQTSLAASNTYVARIEQQLVADPPGVFLADVSFPAGRSPDLHNFQYQAYFGPRYERLWL